MANRHSIVSWTDYGRLQALPAGASHTWLSRSATFLKSKLALRGHFSFASVSAISKQVAEGLSIPAVVNCSFLSANNQLTVTLLLGREQLGVDYEASPVELTDKAYANCTSFGWEICALLGHTGPMVSHTEACCLAAPSTPAAQLKYGETYRTHVATGGHPVAVRLTYSLSGYANLHAT